MLFPEGVSHDEPHPMKLKTGVARLYHRALELTPEECPPPVIIPVGLHYDAKRLFGSNALVAFHPPLQNPPPPGVSEIEQRAQARELTDELGRVLHEVVYVTESWELHHGLHRTRKILRAERAHRAGRRTALLPPLLTIGVVANLPAGATVFVVSKGCAKAEKDEASLKLILGAIAFPATWLALAWLAALGVPQLAAVYPTFPGVPGLTGAMTFVLSVVGAFVVVHYQRLARQTLRSVRVRLTRRRRAEAIRRLREERSALSDDLVRLARERDRQTL